jgi:hypothetical protein
LSAVAIVLPTSLPVRVAASEGPQTKAQTAQPPTAQNAPPDFGWPRTYALTGGTAVLYQPQIESWDDQQKHMTAWSAVSYTAAGAQKPALGTIKIEANTKVALEDRMVSFNDFTISESNFSTMSRDDARTLVAALMKSMPDSERVISLDRVLEAIDRSKIRPKDVAGVKADPPKIFASSTPAILVTLDGDPIWSPIKENDLEYAVNTNWDLFHHKPSNVYYVRDEASWLQAPDLKGPWTAVKGLPGSFKKLDDSENWKDVKANLPGRQFSKGALPKVFYSTEPAELILTTGEPAYEPVTGTSLLWVKNTESDVFRLGQTGAFYFLVAGRWFSATSLQGPWTFATPNLPPDFKKIPLEHPRSRVLASVPGTDQANEAVLLATIPQTARVNKKELKPPDVEYDGDPKFQKIESTNLERAVNTDKDIIKVGDLYYMCFQAVWFVSKSPTGPWEVASSVPKEIYSIPSSSPSYNVTYVTVEDDDSNDDWVTFAYVAGYTGMMIAWGCAVWGTGWYYPPYVRYGGFYPAYYGYGRTYGMGAYYNPWTGAYGRGYRAYGPYGGAGMGAAYNPRTGTYARGAAAYGPYGGRATAQAYNPRTGGYAQTRQGSNVYGNWGSSSVQRGDNWARTAHTTNYRTGTTTRAGQTSAGGGAVSRSGPAGRTAVAQGAGGNVYAGHDGNVYRNTGGSWQQWNNGSWGASSNTRPVGGTDRTGSGIGVASGTGSTVGNRGTTTSQLDRDRMSREAGAQRSSGSSTFRTSPSPRGAGSYRGTTSRGGGGRRR